jgi:2-hydroxychromene-2-carboxylate isomerase
VAEGPATFYFDVNSPYAYLAANRIGELIPGAVWRPVALPMIFRAREKIPWSLQPGREVNMADCERRAAERGLPPMTWPEGWPAETWSFDPLRAAVVAEEQGVLRPFALECYRLIFAENRPLNDVDNVLDAARASGLDPDEVRERIGEPAVKERLREYTDEAIELGAVGVPTVAVGGELFWGDDRLDEAARAAGSAAA